MLKKIFTAKNMLFMVTLILLLLLVPKIIGILLLFFAAYVLACALEPYVVKLSKKIKRSLAVATVLSATFLSVLAIFVPIFVIGYNEIASLIKTMPQKLVFLSNFFKTAKIFNYKISDFIDFNSIDYTSIIGNSSNLAQNVINQSMNFTVGVMQFIVVLIAMSMIVFYILADKDYLKKKFLELFPPDLKNKAKIILLSISDRVGGYVRAQLISMVTIGLMVAFMLWILGVEYPLFLGLLSGILDIVPLLGPTIALGLILIAGYQLGVIKIVLIIVLFLLIQQLSNYLIRPLLFGKFMSLHPLTIFLALFLADQFLGFWGVLLSPAIAATVCVLIDELYIIPINKNVDIVKR